MISFLKTFELSAMFSSPVGVAGIWQAGFGVVPACRLVFFGLFGTARGARHVNTPGGFSHA